MRKLISILFLFFSGAILAQPVGYYNGTEGLQGTALKTKLHEIIRGHNSLSYYFSRHVMYYSDADPNVPGNVILIYTGRSQNGNDYGTGGNKINREHVWAKSHGQFSGILPMDSDVHNLKPADASVNTDRSNLDFDWSLYYHPEATECKFTPGVSWEPRNAVKGDVARIIFYMDSRYEWTNGEINLTVVDKVDTYPQPEHGKLSTLLDWNEMDPTDQFDHNRNNVIYRFQKNRNPFTDNPNFVGLIWGGGALPFYTIGNVSVSDDQPYEGQAITVSCTIDPTPPTGSVKVMTGSKFNVLNVEIAMNFSDGKWQAQLPPGEEGEAVYFAVKAGTGNDVTYAPTYSYRIAMAYQGQITSIQDIQGSGNNSPFQDLQVTTTGVVTAFLTNGYFIQAGQGPRSGLFVYDPSRYPSIGDSVVVSGLVKEYYNLTEIANVSMFKLIKTDRRVPEPQVITSNEIDEEWESVLVRVQDAVCTFTQHWNNSGMWRVSDGAGQVNVQNNDVFSVDPVLNKSYTITGPLNYTYSSWKIELRSLQDISDPTGIGDMLTSNSLNLYPNPSSAEFTIQLPSNAGKNQEIRIFDMMGREKLIKKIDPGVEEVRINLLSEGFIKGVYFVVYGNNQVMTSEKIIFLPN